MFVPTGALLANSSDAENSRPQDDRQHRFTYFTTTLLMWYFWTQVFDSLQKADNILCSSAATVKINDCRQTICDWSMRATGSGLSKSRQRRYLVADCFSCC